MRRAALAAFLTLACAAPAQAATFGISGSSLVYQASAGEVNQPAVNYFESEISVSQYMATITPGAGCSTNTSGATVCPAAGITSMVIRLGDRDDRLQVSGSNGANLPATVKLKVDGGAGKDTLYGTKAGDTILGGSGPDMLYGAGGKDTITGGTGNDRLQGQGLLHGNAGNDYLVLFYENFRVPSRAFGDGGNDNILGGNKVADTVDCGAGSKDQFTSTDNTSKRRLDKFKPNCERHFL